MDDSKFWNLDEGLTVGYSLVPHTLVALLLNSETLTKSEIKALSRKSWKFKVAALKPRLV